jgi:hypothetical protein
MELGVFYLKKRKVRERAIRINSNKNKYYLITNQFRPWELESKNKTQTLPSRGVGNRTYILK